MAQEEKLTRRLAAILAADIVGYSALMGQDDEVTLGRLKKLRREVLEPIIAVHGGRIFKSTGDGVLVEFASPVEAARCAVEVQETLSQGSAENFQLRIGISLGDVIAESDGDIYGEGVNLAARLEQVADPGGVIISGSRQSVHGPIRSVSDMSPDGCLWRNLRFRETGRIDPRWSLQTLHVNVSK